MLMNHNRRVGLSLDLNGFTTQLVRDCDGNGLVIYNRWSFCLWCVYYIFNGCEGGGCVGAYEDAVKTFVVAFRFCRGVSFCK